MARTRRVVIDTGFDQNGQAWDETGSLVSFQGSYQEFTFPFEIISGSNTISTVVLWNNGIVSFGPPTTAQIDFVASGLPPFADYGVIDPADNPGFPGEFFSFAYDDNAIRQSFSYAIGLVDFAQPFILAEAQPTAFFEFGDEQIIFVEGGFTILTDSLSSHIGYKVGSAQEIVVPVVGDPFTSLDFEQDGIENFFTFNGTNAAETIQGTQFNDQIFGNGGDDALSGNGGDDTLVGGLGADVLNGGADTDTVSYASDVGFVFVNLSTGQGFGNAAQGDTFIDIENVIGTASGDVFIGDSGVNRLDGAGGNDILIGGLGADVLIGGDGIDTASYSDNQGAVFVNLSTGQGFGNAAQGDTYQSIENLEGSAFNDFFIGDGGANRLDGAGGNDNLNGNGGNDTLIGGLGADVLNGGADTDTVSYASVVGFVFVNLSTGQGFGNAAQGDTFIDIENVIGTASGDVLIGNSGVNRLDGAGGNDTLIGGLGADVLVGGDGVDTASYSDNWGSVFVNLSTGQGFGNAAQGDTYFSIENLEGSAFNDAFIGDSGANRLDGAGGNDILIGGLGADVLIGGDGSDTADYSDNWGAVFVNLTTGKGNGNAAEGDTYSSIENVTGSVFYDTLIGDAGANVLAGGFGADTLVGNAGADTFVFNTALDGAINVDTINDFTAVDDTIELASSVFGTLAAGTLGADAFVIGSGATTASQRIIYNSDTGSLFYDADGSGAGAAIQFATLGTGLAITNADFEVTGTGGAPSNGAAMIMNREAMNIDQADVLTSPVTYQVDMPGLDMDMHGMGNAFGLDPILAYEAHLVIA